MNCLLNLSQIACPCLSCILNLNYSTSVVWCDIIEIWIEWYSFPIAFQDIDPKGNGVLRADDIPTALGTAICLFKHKMDPQRLAYSYLWCMYLCRRINWVYSYATHYETFMQSITFNNFRIDKKSWLSLIS